MNRLPAFLICIGLLVAPVAGCRTAGTTAPAALPIQLNAPEQVVMGKDAWNGSADCSGAAAITRSPEGITVVIEVTDDQVVADGNRTYNCDSVELYFDLREDKERGKDWYDEGVFQVIIAPAVGEKDAQISWHQGEGGDGWAEVPGTTLESSIIEGKGYMLTVFLPFEGMNENHRVPEASFNFDMGINDADGTERESQLIWRGTDENWRSPTGFATMTP